MMGWDRPCDTVQGDPIRLSIVISFWQVSKSKKKAKPNHFWKWYIDILMSWKRQEKTISPFDVVPNRLVCFQPDWIPHEWALRHTPEHHWTPKTHWNIFMHPKIFPHIPNSFTKLHQVQTETNRQWRTTGDSLLHVCWSQYGANPPFR